MNNQHEQTCDWSPSTPRGTEIRMFLEPKEIRRHIVQVCYRIILLFKVFKYGLNAPTELVFINWLNLSRCSSTIAMHPHIYTLVQQLHVLILNRWCKTVQRKWPIQTLKTKKYCWTSKRGIKLEWLNILFIPRHTRVENQYCWSETIRATHELQSQFDMDTIMSGGWRLREGETALSLYSRLVIH